MTTASIRRHLGRLDQLQHELRVGLKIGFIVIGILHKDLGALGFDFFLAFGELSVWAMAA